MIGKIMKAASFSRCVHYVTGKEEAKNFTYNNYISLIDKGLAKVINRAFSPNNL